MITAAASGAGLSLAAWLLHRYRTNTGLSPDGRYYLAAAEGKPVPSPYHRRWLLPLLLGTKVRRWDILNLVSFVASGTLLSLWFGLWAALFFGFSTGLASLNVRLPVLVDMPAFALSVAAAWSASCGHVYAAIALSFLAGACSERVPVFAALWSWNAWLLLGLLAVNWFGSCAEPDQPWLKRPFQSARSSRDLFDWRRMLLPWGGVMLAVPMLNARALIALAVGYGQCLIAQDDSRLYQWALPALMPCVMLAPHWMLPIAAVFHLAVMGAHRGT